MTLTEKIERVRELLAQRDKLETELAGLLGEESSPPAPPAKVAKAAKTPKTKPPQTSNAASGKRVVTCKRCGKQGHIAKTCTAAAPAVSFGDNDLLTEDQFDELKHLQSIGDLVSKDFAADRGLPLAQVNRAIACRNFEEYANF